MSKFLFIIVSIFSISNANNIDKAKLFLNSLYSHYSNADISYSFDYEMTDTIFAPKLLQLLRLDQKLANGENGYVDYDPLCGCQDMGNFRLKEIEYKEKQDTVFADVKFSISITDIHLLLKLTYNKRRWLIEDIISKDGSLLKFLTKSLSEDNPNSIYKNKEIK